MALAIELVHYLPPHLNYVSTRPHKNWNATLTSWSIDTWDRIPRDIIDKCNVIMTNLERRMQHMRLQGLCTKIAIDQWQTRLHACVIAKGHHFEHYCDLDTQRVVVSWLPVSYLLHVKYTLSYRTFTANYTPKPVLCRTTNENNITFRFLCNVRKCRNISKLKWQINYAFSS